MFGLGPLQYKFGVVELGDAGEVEVSKSMVSAINIESARRLSGIRPSCSDVCPALWDPLPKLGKDCESKHQAVGSCDPRREVADSTVRCDAHGSTLCLLSLRMVALGDGDGRYDSELALVWLTRRSDTL